MDQCENCGSGAPVQCVACTALDCDRIVTLEAENAGILESLTRANEQVSELRQKVSDAEWLNRIEGWVKRPHDRPGWVVVDHRGLTIGQEGYYWDAIRQAREGGQGE